MRHLYFLAFLLLSSNVFAQNMTQKFKLYPNVGSFPRGFHIHENELYFTTNGDAGVSESDLWKTDGNILKIVGKGRDGGNFPHHYIVGGLSNKLYLMVFNSTGLGYNDGIYTYDLTIDSLHLLYAYDDIAHGPHYKGDDGFYFAGKHATTSKLYRYTISTATLDSMYTFKADTSITQIYPAHGRIYIACRYNAAANVNTRSHLHTLDTINKRISPQTVVPGCKGTYILQVIGIGNDIYFFARGSQNGLGDPPNLFKYTGTGTPTRVTTGKDLRPMNDDIVAYNNKVYLAAQYKNQINASFYEINVTNGNEKLIYKNKNTSYYQQFQPKHFYVHNKRLYMSGFDGTLAHQPFVYDGADTPKRIDVLQLYKGVSIPNVPKLYTSYKKWVYFAATDSAENPELWRFHDSLLRPIPQSINGLSQKQLDITAYPNPTTGDTHLDIALDMAQSLSVRLTDMNGRVVYRQQTKLYSGGKHTIDIPMRNLPSGAYICRLIDRNGISMNTVRLIRK